MYTETFLLHLINSGECQKRRDRQIGKHKLNEMEALDMK